MQTRRLGAAQVSRSAAVPKRRARVQASASSSGVKEVTLLDYGAGNIRSIRNAIKKLGFAIKDVRRRASVRRGAPAQHRGRPGLLQLRGGQWTQPQPPAAPAAGRPRRRPAANPPLRGSRSAAARTIAHTCDHTHARTRTHARTHTRTHTHNTQHTTHNTHTHTTHTHAPPSTHTPRSSRRLT
jgi:hypothetical protein